MAMDPDLLAVSPHPVTWPPDVIGTAILVSGAANIIWSIANCYRD
jgi:hypothetical protein